MFLRNNLRLIILAFWTNNKYMTLRSCISMLSHSSYRHCTAKATRQQLEQSLFFYRWRTRSTRWKARARWARARSFGTSVTLCQPRRSRTWGRARSITTTTSTSSDEATSSTPSRPGTSSRSIFWSMIFFPAKKNVGNESFFYEVPSFQFKAVTNQEFRTRRNGWPEYTTIEMVRGSEAGFLVPRGRRLGVLCDFPVCQIQWRCLPLNKTERTRTRFVPLMVKKAIKNIFRCDFTKQDFCTWTWFCI